MVFYTASLFIMSEQIDHSEFTAEWEKSWNQLGQQKQTNIDNIADVLWASESQRKPKTKWRSRKTFKQKMEEIEEEKMAYLAANSGDTSNYAVRSINTVKRLEPLPVSAYYNWKNMPFIEGM